MAGHECDERCRMHTCRPLSRSTVRQIHVILSGALKRAVRWRWIASNPIEHAEAPPQPIARPRPPTAYEAARILNDAWRDPDWAMLVWLTMVTGSRRGELCGLRWRDVDLDGSVLSVERAISQHGAQKWEKDTKTHRSRRLAPLCQDHVRQLPQQLFPLEGVIGDPGVCVNRGAASRRRRAGRAVAAVGSAGR